MPTPAPDPVWDRWNGLAKLIDPADASGAVKVPEAVGEYLQESQHALGGQESQHAPGGTCPPASTPLPRERTRLRESTAWIPRLAGWTQARIAAELGNSQAATRKALRRAERCALARLDPEVESGQGPAERQIRYILGQALQAWHDSKERAERRVSTTVGPRDSYGRDCCDRATTTRTTPENPQSLAIALKALAAERALSGMDRTDVPAPDDAPTIQATRTESVTVRTARLTR